MKYGICLIKTRAEKWVEATRRAEELGFESVWIPEHLVFPIDLSSDFPGTTTPGGEAGPVQKPMSSLPVFDSPSVLNHLAAATSTIRLGTFVYLLGIRHPFVAARAFQTADCFSGGRVDVGVGAGWLRASGERRGWILPPGVDARRRRSPCADGCGPKRWSSTAGILGVRARRVRAEARADSAPYPYRRRVARSAPSHRRVRRRLAGSPPRP